MRAVLEKLRRAGGETPAPDRRQGLRDAKLEATRARQALEAAQRVTARAREVIADADAAERAALDAEKAYTDSIGAWAARGMVGDVAGDPGLHAKSKAARAAADHARLVAQSVADTLTHRQRWDEGRQRMLDIGEAMSGEEKEAHEAVERAEYGVKAEVGSLVREAAESRLQQLLKGPFAELIECKLLPSLYGARFFARGNSQWPADWSSFVADFDAIAALLRFPRFEVGPNPKAIDEKLLEQASRWTNFGYALMRDSDVEFA